MTNKHHRPCSVVIEKSDVVLVKPSDSTPDHQLLLSFSTIDEDPYIETLEKTIYVYKPRPDTIRDHHVEPSSLLQHALSKALVYYYPFAGKLKRREDDRKLQLRCTAEGVPFITATANCTLASLNYLDGGSDLHTANQLVPNYDRVRGYYHPLALQVTKFSCGGFTVGLALSHSVCDGFGAAQFFRAVTELARGDSEPTVKPVWERHRLVGQVLDDDPLHTDPNPKPFDLDVASVATSSYTPTDDDMVQEIVNVTADGIKRLKTRIVKEDKHHCRDEVVSETFTTLEVLAAYVWRAKLRALKLNPEGNTLFGMPISVRRVMEPPLPEGYYGNAFIDVSLTLRGRELNDSPLCRTVKLIKNLKTTALDKQFVMDKLRDMEKTRMTKPEFGGWNGAFMFLSDWRQLGLLDEVDFGWKGAVDVIPLLPVNIPDICLFLAASKLDPAMEGGVRVMVTLPSRHA